MVSEHGFSTNVLRGWHIHRGAMASKNQHLANWSRFQLAWDRMHNSEQAPLLLALAAGPSPPLLLCWARASRRQVTEKPTLNPKKRWKPSPHRRQQQDHLLTVFWKDVGGSKTFLLLKTDSWLGWTNCKNLRTKPLSPLMPRCRKDWVRLKRSIVWLWRTSWRPTTLAVVAVLSQPIY